MATYDQALLFFRLFSCSLVIMLTLGILGALLVIVAVRLLNRSGAPGRD